MNKQDIIDACKDSGVARLSCEQCHKKLVNSAVVDFHWVGNHIRYLYFCDSFCLGRYKKDIRILKEQCEQTKIQTRLQ